MRTKTVTLYNFDELNEAAKERARDWWRELENEDFDTDGIYDDAVNMGALLGITISTHDVKRMDGGYNQHPTIYYSGFSSQGDGACFEGSYQYQKGAVKAIQKEAPAIYKDRDGATHGDKGNAELHRIARELQEIQRKNFYQLTASMRHSGHYYHSGCMTVDAERYDEKEMTTDAEDEITQLMRDFADWIYSSLEAEYDYRMSDESIDEAIKANEYTFNEDGKRED